MTDRVRSTGRTHTRHRRYEAFCRTIVYRIRYLIAFFLLEDGKEEGSPKSPLAVPTLMRAAQASVAALPAVAPVVTSSADPHGHDSAHPDGRAPLGSKFGTQEQQDQASRRAVRSSGPRPAAQTATVTVRTSEVTSTAGGRTTRRWARTRKHQGRGLLRSSKATFLMVRSPPRMSPTSPMVR